MLLKNLGRCIIFAYDRSYLLYCFFLRLYVCCNRPAALVFLFGLAGVILWAVKVEPSLYGIKSPSNVEAVICHRSIDNMPQGGYPILGL